MTKIARGRIRRGLAILLTLGLLTTLAGTSTASAATRKACKKGFARNKARKCVRKKAATTKKTTAKSGATTTTAKTANANKGTIKLGVIESQINSRGQAQAPEGKQMGQAWIDAVNAAGGINGYKFELVYKNVNGDPARALNALKELDKAGVIAFTQTDASVLPPLRDEMTKLNLPVIGGQPYTNEFDWHPMFFQVQAGTGAGTYGQVAAARDVGAKHFLNAYCAEVAACATSVGKTKYAADREGLKFSSQGASAVAPDYTALCLSAKNDGVDFFQSNGLNFANVIRDCSRQNYHPTYAQGGAANQAVIDAAKGENVAGNLFEFGIFYNGPEVQRFRQALAHTDQKVEDGTATQSSVQVWLAMEMIGAITKRLTTTGVPTRQQFIDTIYTIHHEDLGGQIAPQDYSVQRPGTGKHAASDCWTEHIVKDGKLYHMDTHGQIVTKLTFICGTGAVYTSTGPPALG
ncbi:MAG: ABC transporter substrate-binding protein [Acidobacteria bacterium]|nr:ABC transporter substrate-binding protein [Acidobacteriota bacterium]